MSFLTPLFLLLGLLAIPIIILYMLKLRRREMLVSSTLLWQMVLRDREANRPWQRLRRNLLLFLQLLLLAALVFALARPFIPVPVVAAGQVTVLLDGSASMFATDMEPSRFAVAQEAALQIVDGLASDGEMTVILVGRQPQVLISAATDKSELRQAIAAANPFSGAADWESAVALAAGAARNATEATTVIISDGGLPDDLQALPGDVRYIPVGASAANLGLTALSVRPAADAPQLYARVTNFGSQPAETILSINTDGVLLNAQRVTVPAGETVGVNLELFGGTQLVEARLSAPPGDDQPDYLSLDDRAWAVNDPPRTGRVLLVSKLGNLFIEQVLAVLPGIQPFRITADQPLPADPFDLYIFDGVLPQTVPDAEILFINPPPPGNEIIAVGEEYAPTLGSALEVHEHPIGRFVDWNSVQFLRIRAVELAPELAPQFETVAALDGRPLLLAGEVGPRRMAVLSFDIRDSDLPLQVAFPILFANVVDWLTPGTVISTSDDVVRPGDAVSIRPDIAADAVAILKPDGDVRTASATEGGIIFADTDQLGLYAVATGSAADYGQASDVGLFAVNLFSADESNIEPRETISVGRSPVSAALREEVGQREFWPWLAGFALLLLLLEWWVYHRSSTLPAAPGWRGWFRRRSTA